MKKSWFSYKFIRKGLSSMFKTEQTTADSIKKLISSITEAPDKCGFDVYIITKTEPQLKKMGFLEDKSDNLNNKLKQTIFDGLTEKYSAAEYVSVDRIADEQMKMYLIPISEDYDPLSVLNTVPGSFSQKDIHDATGIAYSIRIMEKHLWAYQHLWSILIPNKSRKNLMAKLISNNEGDVFAEMNESIITFTEKIDLLVVDNYIVSSDYKLLQKSFGFQTYIQKQADRTISAIEGKSILTSTEKLWDYIKRGNGKPKYAKKMLRISNSKVLNMDTVILWENIHKSARWNGKLKEENGKFVIEHYTDVELLIDLLDERYTRSEITGEEYDTDVKQIASPIE